MFFVFHYILLNAAALGVVILTALYLQTWSDASLTEIGTLLMILPFLSIIIKPLLCAFADRQQAHKSYMIGTCFFIMLGYGSLIIYPFFPDFMRQHSRLVWYLECLGVIVGFSAFGVVWSLGDALAVNRARVRGVTWGSYRVWGTVSWGVFGYLVGQVNEVDFLPKYSPAFMLLVAAMLLEIVLIVLWPCRDFDMSSEGADELGALEIHAAGTLTSDGSPAERQRQQAPGQPGVGGASGRASLDCCPSGSARLNGRLVARAANVLAEDIGQSLRSSLRLTPTKKRPALADVLAEHAHLGSGAPIDSAALSVASKPAQQQQRSVQNSPTLGRLALRRLGATEVAQNSGSICANSSGVCVDSSSGANSRSGTFTRAAMRGAQLALTKMNSLSSTSGHAIANDLNHLQANQGTLNEIQGAELMKKLNNLSASPAGSPRLGVAVSDRAQGITDMTVANQTSSRLEEGERHMRKSVEDLQMVLLKLIVKRDRNILKYLVMFTVYGVLLFVHITYFFLHVEQICKEKQYDFSNLIGIMLIAQSVSEILGFALIAPYYMPWVGRLGSIMTVGMIYFFRYAFYGTYFVHMSPYTAILTETCHGFAYGIVYSLVTEIAIDSVDQLDDYLPELIARKIVDPNINPEQLKLPLRATMQGVYSGAFDGLGNGIGALFAGIFLDYYSFVSLWQCCALMSIVMIVLYPLTEWRSLRSYYSRAKKSAL